MPLGVVAVSGRAQRRPEAPATPDVHVRASGANSGARGVDVSPSASPLCSALGAARPKDAGRENGNAGDSVASRQHCLRRRTQDLLFRSRRPARSLEETYGNNVP